MVCLFVFFKGYRHGQCHDFKPNTIIIAFYDQEYSRNLKQWTFSRKCHNCSVRASNFFLSKLLHMWLNYLTVLPWFISCTWKWGRREERNNVTLMLLAIMISTCIGLSWAWDFVTKPILFTFSTLPCMLGCVRTTEWDNLVQQVYPDGVLETYFGGKFIYLYIYNCMDYSELWGFFFFLLYCLEMRKCHLLLRNRHWNRLPG